MKRSDPILVQQQPNSAAIPSPLRYYHPELQNAWNAEPFVKDRVLRAQDKGKKLQAAYRRQLATLAPRISKQTFARFSDSRAPLFDADLFEFSFGDSLGFAISKSRNRQLATTIQAIFSSFSGDKLHILTYSNITALNVNVPSDRWFDARGTKRIDSLLADELTPVDAKFMQHACLFASGATITIQFERVRWQTRAQ
jgi:hypothetical protein